MKQEKLIEQQWDVRDVSVAVILTRTFPFRWMNVNRGDADGPGADRDDHRRKR